MPSLMILEAFGYEAAGEMFAARFAINFAVSTIVSRAFAAQPGMSQTTDNGVRQQVPPSNTNSIPMIYGTAYTGGTFVDAVLSTDQQTMYYVMAISHAVPDGGGSIGFNTNKMYYGDQLITFSGGDFTSVASLTDTAGNVDTKINGNLNIYLYRSNESGVISGINTSAVLPSTVMGGSDIDAALRWPSSGRQMNGLLFAIVKLKYNRDAGTTSLSPITFNVTNKVTADDAVGNVWYDYMTNTKYGAAMDASIVDTVSRDALNAYSLATISYTPSGGGSATQARYTINGVIDTSKDCLSNIDQIMLACDSWNQYNATTGKWAIVINKEESTSFAFDDSNIVGDIRISAQDITQSINQIEAQFPNSSNKDQQDYVYIQTPSNLLYVNEPVNKYTIKYELVNNSVQAQYLANRQLEQAREDLIVSINTPYPGIQVDAGDVVSITNAFYGWNAKLFRVMKVVESASPEGGLGASLDLTEYNAQVYDNASITAFTPAPNSNLSSPNYFSALTVPSISATYTTVTVPNFNISVSIPSIGRVTGIRVFYSVAGAADWKVLAFEFKLASTPFTPGSTFVFKDLVLPSGTYDFSYTVLNDIGGSAVSPTLSSYVWATYPSKIGTNLVSASNVVQSAIDVNNQYGIAPSSNEIVYINQTYVPSGGGWAYAAHFLATGGDAVPLALTVGGIGSVQAAHMWLQPTSGLPTSFIANGGVAYTGTHMYLADGTNWRQVYCQGDTIPSTPTFTAQSANTVLAGPTSGAAAVPTFRALVAADVPTLNQNTTGYAAYLQSTTSTGGTHTLQAFQDNTNFIYGYDLRATGTTSPVLRFLDGSTGNVLAALRANSSGLTSIDSTGSPTQFTASVITGTRLVSTIATGTAPLTVASTTRVSNLNVATAGTADALLNGNRQAIAGTYAWDSWNFYSNSASLSSINLFTRTGTWLAQLYADGVSTGFLAAYGAGTFDLEKVINGNLYVRIAGLQLAVLTVAGGTLTGQLNLTGSTSVIPLVVRSSTSSYAGYYQYTGSASTTSTSILTNGSVTYISTGTYYSGGSWVYNQVGGSSLFALSEQSGASWYSGNGASYSNVASNVSLWDQAGVWKNTVNTSGTVTAGNVQIATGGYVGLNGSTTYGIGVQTRYYSGFFDTVDSGVSSDPLELVYYSGSSVIVGTGTYGSKPLYAGSLYDAGSRVVSVAGGQSVQSTTYFASNTNGSSSYIYAAIQLRESVYGGNSGYLAPRLAFHWGGVVASQIGMDTAGKIQILNNPGSAYENIGFNYAYASGTFRRNSAGLGWLDGQYGTAEQYYTSMAIYSIGGAYVPGVYDLGNMYGIGYAYSGYAPGNPNGVPSSRWGMYTAESGVARIFLDATNGTIWATSDAFFGGGVHTGGSQGGGFFGAANANKFYNSGGIVEVLLESGSGGPHLEFSASSSYDWHFASTTGGDFYFTQTSTRDIMYMRGSDGWLINNWGFSSPNKYFEITHPIREGHQLRHSSVESPRYDLIYRGHVSLVDGVAVLNMDTDAVSDGGQTMTPGTFEALTRDADIFVQNQTGWEPVRGSLEGATLTIVCKDLTSMDTVSWMVVAERKDAALTSNENQSTDNQGRMFLEVVTTHSASDAATRPLRTKVDIYEGL